MSDNTSLEIRITKGHPAPEEVAALVAVLTSRLAQPKKTESDETHRPVWTSLQSTRLPGVSWIHRSTALA
jgi:hypothetical protein